MPEKGSIIKKFKNSTTKNSKFSSGKKQFTKQKPFKQFDKKNSKVKSKKPFVKFFKWPKIVRTP